jgi:tryptophan 2-monooxygenase
MDAFGGWGAVLGHRVGAPQQGIKLSQLNRGYHRFPDTYHADYASLLRDPATGKDLGPLSPIPNGGHSRRVGLVGGGIGNLIAAYELARCGIETHVFEATARVGGRLHTHYLGSTIPCELGAMRFPDKSKLLWHYYAKYWADQHPGDDPELRPFPNPGVVPTHINWQDGVYQFCTTSPYDAGSDLPQVLQDLRSQLQDRWGPSFSVPNPPHVDITLRQVQEVLAKPVLSRSDSELVMTFWNYCVDKYESRSFGSVLADAWYDSQGKLMRWGTNELNAFATLGLGTGGFGPLFGVSFLELLRLFLWDYSVEYQLPGTLTDFALWMADQAKKAGSFIHTNAPVRHITAMVDPKVPRPWVVFDVNDQEWKFDYAIVGMSTRAMQYLKLDANRAPGARAPAAVRTSRMRCRSARRKAHTTSRTSSKAFRRPSSART